ncbi:ribonuclease HII [Candidatus Kaiserbacteria bacterium]|nr:ribonuclease HII [Candidatus Kaiserbacteria bacterium]
MQWIVGVDEAGRGALAGPVSVGAVLYPSDFDWQELYALVTRRGPVRLRDSKQLSAQQREILFEKIAEHGRLKHAVGFVTADVIDQIGIVNATHEAAAAAIRALGISPERACVQLDAGLRAPSEWQQESFVRGDATYPAIAFASIIAKVSRDRLMEDFAEEYPAYGFEGHKGYGTTVHTAALARHGMSMIHRRTFVHLRSC